MLTWFSFKQSLFCHINFITIFLSCIFASVDTHRGVCLWLQHSSGTCENIISERGGCVFAWLGVMTACRFPVTSTWVLRLQKEKGSMQPYLPLCWARQCVYSAVCDVISECVSYDLPAPDEVLSTGVGVSVSSDRQQSDMCAFISQRKYTEMFLMILPLFHTYDATSQSLRCVKCNYFDYECVCQNMSLYVKVDNMLMLSFVSACVHVCLSSLCLLPILSSTPNLYSGQVGSSTDPQLSN